jgi:hypothetical protein
MVRRFITVLLIASALLGSLIAAASAASGPTGGDFLRLCGENKAACMFYVAGFAEGAAAAPVKQAGTSSCGAEPRAYVQLNLAFQALLEAARAKGDTRVLDEPAPILLARFMRERGFCIGSRDDVAAAQDSRAAGKEALGR